METNGDTLDDVKHDLYGNTRRGIVGAIPRLKVVEDAVEHFQMLETKMQGILIGLGINVFGTIVLLLAQFGIL